MNVWLLPSYNLTTTLPSGLVFNNSGGLVLTQDAGSNVTALTTAISATNNSGAVNLSLSGNISNNGGGGGGGVSISNGGMATSLNIHQLAGSINTSGQSDNGIYASNDGTGATAVTTAGTVSSAGDYSNGILAVQNGSGALSIEQTAGSISATGASSNGVQADLAAANTGGATLTQAAGATISGVNYGARITNAGSGFTSVTTAGSVTATNTYALSLINGATTTGLTVNQTAGSLTGGVGGINASNSGTGITSITAAGNVTGGIWGIYSYKAGTGATTVTSSGSVTGTAVSGIAAYNNSAAATDIEINQTAGLISGGRAGIYAYNRGTGTTTVTTAGRVTGGTGFTFIGVSAIHGAGIQTDTIAGRSVAINLLSGSDVSATSGVAIRDDAGNATVDMASGAKLTGQVLLGNGNDAMIIHGGADIGAVTLLDGGNSTDGSVTDILGTAGAATNKLTFDGATYSLAGSLMKNWQTVTLDNSQLTFAGDAALVTGTGLNPDSSRQGLNLINASTLTSPIALAVTGDVYIDPTSTLNHALGGSISGNVTNAGLIYWGNLGQTLLVGGNYVGVPGSRISL